jgi:hypothetical protein
VDWVCWLAEFWCVCKKGRRRSVLLCTKAQSADCCAWGFKWQAIADCCWEDAGYQTAGFRFVSWPILQVAWMYGRPAATVVAIFCAGLVLPCKAD